MSKRKATKISTPVPKASGFKVARELVGLILLFFGLYLLLSLITFDTRDPGFNHAISAAKGVHNSAGVIGSYLGGMLTDIFGIAAYIWPIFFLLLALRQLFYHFSIQWWRFIGFICLLLCLMMAGSAWEFRLGDIVGGGLIGNAIYGVTWKFLSAKGSLLLGTCFFLISLQLIFSISWLTVVRAIWLWIASGWQSPESSDEPEDPNPKGVTGKEKGKGQKTEQSLRPSSAPKIQPVDKGTYINDKLTDDDVIDAPQDDKVYKHNNPQEHSDKTGFLARIKNIFSHKTVSSTNTSPAPFTNSLISEEELNATTSKQEWLEDDKIEQGRVDLQKDQSFFHEEGSEGLNPFASPWARACDIQGEWEQNEIPTNHPNLMNVQAGISDKDEAVRVGPNGGLIIEGSAEAYTEEEQKDFVYDTMHDSPMPMQENPPHDDFVFDTLPEDASETEMQSIVIIDHIDNRQEGQSDYEIELDATMAVQSTEDESFILDSGDEPSFENSEQNQEDDFIVETVEDEALSENAVSPEEATPQEDCLEETSFDDRTLSSPEQDSNYNAQAFDTHDINASRLNHNSPEPLPSHHELSPSFEVLMDADKDGITDLTEEEVGVGGAAKAAPVKVKTRLPHLNLLQDIAEDEHSKPRLDILTEKGERLTRCLSDFGIQGELTRITPGPVVTMFEFRPAPGIKVSRIANLSDDLALALKAIAVRIQAPIPGTDTVGIEIPNEMRETIYFKELLASQTFHDAGSLLTLAVGKDSAGRPSVADLAKMPHLLVAGATGAGKSVCLNSILLSFLYKARPEDVQLLLIDPKRIELAVYADLPHLVHPVVTDMSHAKNALDWAVHEMDKRYEGMARLGVRNIAGYNQKLEGFGDKKPIEFLDLEFMPYLVIIIDELADLMLTAAKEVETSIVRLAQLARAAGIHMVLATQRPSVDVVTGLIKANFPCRISFQVTSKHDSRTILDTVGAEHLLGRGDMLFKPSGGRLQRLHGAFVSDDEVGNVVEFWKRQQAPMYRVDFAQWGNEATQDSLEGGAGALADDPIYNDAVEFVMGQGRASISLVQRRFRIGFNKAARYVEQMEQDGIIGPADGSKPRLVIKGREA